MKVNILVVFIGSEVIHLKPLPHMFWFEAMRRQLQADAKVRGNPGNTELPSPMHDALVTYAHDFRENGNPLVFDAIRQIRRNLREGVVRLKDLSEGMGVRGTCKTRGRGGFHRGG